MVRRPDRAGGMRILLDTPMLLWWVADDPQLPQSARAAISSVNAEVYVSAISLAEISIKQSRGKLVVDGDLPAAIDGSDFRSLSFTAEHGYRLAELPWHHRDPFDRMLVAPGPVRIAGFCDRRPCLFAVRRADGELIPVVRTGGWPAPGAPAGPRCRSTGRRPPPAARALRPAVRSPRRAARPRRWHRCRSGRAADRARGSIPIDAGSACAAASRKLVLSSALALVSRSHCSRLPGPAPQDAASRMIAAPRSASIWNSPGNRTS